MTKKKKKKKINFVRVTIFIIILVFLCFLVRYVLNIKTKNIIIHGNNYYNDEKIIEAAGIENYPKFLLLNRRSTAKKIKKLDLIQDVKISKKNHFVLDITVKEKKILFLKRSTNEYILSDEKSIDLDNINGVPILINYVPEKVEKKLIKEMSKLNTNIIASISEIEYNKTDFDNERFIFYMNDTNKVYITISKIEVMNKYENIVTKFNGKRGVLNLDSGNYLEIKE